MIIIITLSKQPVNLHNNIPVELQFSTALVHHCSLIQHTQTEKLLEPSTVLESQHVMDSRHNMDHQRTGHVSFTEGNLRRA